MKNEQIAFDPSIPKWFRILNIEDTEFEKSKYAGPLGPAQSGKWRIKDINTLKKVIPESFEMAANEVKEFNETSVKHGGAFKKIASIPAEAFNLQPELAHDRKALDKFLNTFPEFKIDLK